ncbi:fimbrial protein [Bacteroides eggerthii]|uniref:fimbrial protein n=1 Tax=Bacteroides eggerthii TaxID=28111 RepID=UPI00189FE5E1|nr:fimbrial protein [Bacteroides eggerthii]
MKKIKFLAVALAAFTMFSCTNDEVENLGNNVPGEQAVLTIKLKGDGDNQAQSRAAGPATDTEDAVINNYLVFLFRDGGALDCAPYESNSNAAATITTGTTAAKKAYVIANTGALAGGPFAAVKTETDLLAVTGSLMDNTNNVSTQTKTNLWMSGAEDVTFNGTTGTTTVTLSYVAAKIQLIVKDNRKNMSTGTIQIEDKEVVLLFAGKSGKFFGTQKSVQTDFYTGDDSYNNPFNTNVTKSTALSDAVTVPFAPNAGGTVFNHFYTFGNDGTTQPTILAIKSTKTVNSTPSTIYYPVHFTTADAGETIEPGKSYTVTVTLNGDVEAGGGGGTTDPEEPVVSSSIEVTVTAAQWVTQPVSKEFN